MNIPILSVPTNIITGFLGSGKTTAILHLLKQKPANERWAILVNEFGEIGVDGSLLAGQINTDNIYIEEVSGGCMCCASNLPMQVALNKLLKKSRPHRLIIEPTGLGHPKEMLAVLSKPQYKNVLNLEKTITLIDARQIEDTRYTEHEVYNQQLDIADVIVGNKSDLYDEHYKELLSEFLRTKKLINKTVHYTVHGQLSLGWLTGAITPPPHSCNNHENKASQPPSPIKRLKSNEVIKATNTGEGFRSIGWRYSPHMIFNRTRVLFLMKTIKAVRIKAIFITSDGIYGYNKTPDSLNEVQLNNTTESRIEIICQDIEDEWEELITKTIITSN